MGHCSRRGAKRVSVHAASCAGLAGQRCAGGGTVWTPPPRCDHWFALLVLTAVCAMAGCECAHRHDYEMAESTGTTGDDATAATSTEETQATDDAGDPSRFFGVFHNESYFVPLGMEVVDPGSATVANVHIRPGGTASMTVEWCSRSYGTRMIEWRWELRRDGWLHFTPGPGEESLRFLAWTGLESVRATIVNQCDVLFEIEGDITFSETFRPGEACWVKRCEHDRVHIDYCEGEPPPPCA